MTSRHNSVDGGYGWVCVACSFTINALSWGIVASYGVYLAYYTSTNSFEGATAIEYSLIGGINFGAAMAASPAVTKLSQRYGPRLPMFLGAICLGGGFIAASFAVRIWQLFLSQGVLVGLGVGLLYLPSINILPQWFDKRRSLASAISSAGSGIGGLIFSLATGVMIRNLSLSWALRITGCIALVGNVLAVLLVRSRDDEVRPRYRLFDVSLLKRTDVGLLLSWEFIMLFGYATIQFSLSDYAIAIGLSQSKADIVTALLNVGIACGRPFIVLLSDRFGRFRVTTILTLLIAILCFAIWIPANELGPLLVFALLSGGSYGVFFASIGPLSVEVVGLTDLPALLSLAWLVAIAPTTVGALISLQLKNALGHHPYLVSQLFTALCYLVAAGILFALSCRHPHTVEL